MVADSAAAFARLDTWRIDLAPTAPGWLGTTAGVTDEGELVALVRFASTADARASSDRVEQGMWWAKSATVFAGDVSFDNYENTTLFGDGGTDDAPVVEVLLGRVRARRGHTDLAAELGARSLALGSDVVGGVVGLHEDGRLALATYFRTDTATSAGERDVAGWVKGSANLADARLLRLRNLWFGAPDPV